jgi:hypothetical protein
MLFVQVIIEEGIAWNATEVRGQNCERSAHKPGEFQNQDVLHMNRRKQIGARVGGALV